MSPLPHFATGDPLGAAEANLLARQGVITVETTLDRDNLPAPHDGMVCFVEDDQTYYARVGGAWWVLWRDTGWQEITPASGVTGVFRGRRVGNLIEIRWNCTSSIAAGAIVSPLFTAPPEFRPATVSVAASFMGASAYMLAGELGFDGNLAVRNIHSSALASHRGQAIFLAG